VIQIDHVVYAVRDLDAAAERFRRAYGLGSVAGGRHAGWGTGNRIVPLGDQYVELISVVDPEEVVIVPGRSSVGPTNSTGSRPGSISRSRRALGPDPTAR
jgi:hypothetical protein